MPNWTENKVTVTGDKEAVAEFIEFVKDGDSVFSFEKIMPTPECLNIASGSETYQGMEAMNDTERWNDLSPKTRALTRRAMVNIEALGEKDWYYWRRKRWGTKWDCCEDVITDQCDGFIQYQFQTAWNGPDGIATALRSAFPELTITWQCLNEEHQCIENPDADEDSDDRWVYVCLDENPNTYEI